MKLSNLEHRYFQFSHWHSLCPEAVEVLLRNQAYVLKRIGPADGDEGGKVSLKNRRWTWSKHGGPVGAWEAIKEAAHWFEALPEFLSHLSSI